MRPIHPKYQDIDVTNCYRYERCTMKTQKGQKRDDERLVDVALGSL
jgi:hypothetical protein